MDKKLIELLRKIFSLDDKTLPDSMTSEDFGKFIDSQKGKLFSSPEDLKNLQKIVSSKDLDLKKSLEELKSLKEKSDEKKTDSEKQIEVLTGKIGELTDNIKTINKDAETKKLKEKYPDILPELLVGRKDDEIEKIVDRQREVNKKLYGDSDNFRPPDYSSEAEIDEKVSEIKGDKSKSGETSAMEVLNLNRKRADLDSGG